MCKPQYSQGNKFTEEMCRVGISHENFAILSFTDTDYFSRSFLSFFQITYKSKNNRSEIVTVVATF